MDWLLRFLTKIKPILESLAFLTSIGLFTTIIIGLNQLKLVKKDMSDRNRRAAVETSLKYLDLFATKFIPNLTEYRQKYNIEVPNPENTDRLFDGNFNLSMRELPKEVAAEVIVSQKLGLLHFFNELEYFSVGVLNKLADEDIIYTPISGMFCRAIRREHVYLSVLRNQGAPYKNIVLLFNKWTDRMEIEELQLQKLSAEHKIRSKGDSYKSSPPIGLE